MPSSSFYDVNGERYEDWFIPTESAPYGEPPQFLWPVAAVAGGGSTRLSWIEGPDWDVASAQLVGTWTLVVADAGSEQVRLDLGMPSAQLLHADTSARPFQAWHVSGQGTEYLWMVGQHVAEAPVPWQVTDLAELGPIAPGLRISYECTHPFVTNVVAVVDASGQPATDSAWRFNTYTEGRRVAQPDHGDVFRLMVIDADGTVVLWLPSSRTSISRTPRRSSG